MTSPIDRSSARSGTARVDVGGDGMEGPYHANTPREFYVKKITTDQAEPMRVIHPVWFVPPQVKKRETYSKTSYMPRPTATILSIKQSDTPLSQKKTEPVKTIKER